MGTQQTMSELSSDGRNGTATQGRLAPRRFGLRFADSTTEAEYSRWREVSKNVNHSCKSQ